MPAFNEEIRAAVEEGVQVKELIAPLSMKKDGRDILLTLQKMNVQKRGTPGGRARVAAANSRPESLRVQHVITAIGSAPDVCWVPTPRHEAELIRFDHCTLAFNGLPTVYSGDLVNRVQSIPDAVASGKAAAMVIDTYFNEGRNWIEKRLSKCRIGSGPALSMAVYTGGGVHRLSSQRVDYHALNIDYFSPAPRTEPGTRTADERIRSFAVPTGNLSAVDAVREAERCFSCGRCNACGNCELFCPEVAVSVDGESKKIDLDFCKGCGICVVECPRNVMSLKEARHEADT